MLAKKLNNPPAPVPVYLIFILPHLADEVAEHPDTCTEAADQCDEHHDNDHLNCRESFLDTLHLFARIC